MKNKLSSGISLSVSNRDAKKTNLILTCFLSSALGVLFSISLITVANAEISFAVAMPVAISALFFAFSKRSKLLTIGIACVVIVFAVIFRDSIILGAKTILNNIYSLSESSQSYIYVHYDVPAETNMLPAIMLIIVAFSILVSLFAINSWSLPMVFVGVGIALLEMYYGISPQPLMNMAMFLLIMLLCLSCSQMSSSTFRFSVVLITVLSIALSSIVYYAAPKEFKNISIANEQIRDLFDEGESAVSNAIMPDFLPDDIQVNNQDAQIDNGDNVQDNQNESNGNGGNNKKGINTRTVSWNIVSVVVFVALASAIAFWIIVVVFSSLLRKQKLNQKSPKIVINYCFRKSLKLLQTVGLELDKSLVPSDYIDSVCDIISQDYADEYSKQIELWQKSVYSNYNITQQDASQSVTFYRNTRKIALNKANIFRRFIIVFVKLM